MTAKSKTVLLIDDRPLNLDYMAVRLEFAGYSVLCERGGADALYAARLTRPDIIVCDIKMPSMDGYQFCREVRKDPELASVPIILYSAYEVTTESMELARAAGATSVLTSTPDTDPLVQEIRRLEQG